MVLKVGHQSGTVGLGHPDRCKKISSSVVSRNQLFWVQLLSLRSLLRCWEYRGFCSCFTGEGSSTNQTCSSSSASTSGCRRSLSSLCYLSEVVEALVKNLVPHLCRCCPGAKDLYRCFVLRRSCVLRHYQDIDCV